MTALEKAIDERKIITCFENDEIAGYLYYGAVRSGRDTVIYQACVDYDSRRRHLGWGMVRELMDICNASFATGIRLRDASSNESNDFWKAIGFYCTKTKKGGARRSRYINFWRTDLQKPLFVLPEIEPDRTKSTIGAYLRKKKANVPMASRWSRSHY